MTLDKILLSICLFPGLGGSAVVYADAPDDELTLESAGFAVESVSSVPLVQRAELPQSHLNALNIEADMLKVPSGCFLMGSPEDEIDRDHDEGPQQKICLDSFSIGKYEVTQGLWKQVMGNNPSNFKLGDNHPVEMVSWHDVQLFLQRLNDATGKHYRLPSEAEWEYVARAGTDTPFWWQPTKKRSLFGAPKLISHVNANFGKEDCCSGYATDKDQWVHTAPVGSFAASPWGTHDMRGNVWEWVQDCYKESYTGVSANGAPWSSDECKHHVFRGGGWDNGPTILRAANRSWDEPNYRFSGLGFRLAQTVQPLQVRVKHVD